MGCLFLLLLSDFSSHWPPGLLLWAIFFGLIVVVGSLSALGWFSEKCILLGRKKGSCLCHGFIFPAAAFMWKMQSARNFIMVNEVKVLDYQATKGFLASASTSTWQEHRQRKVSGSCNCILLKLAELNRLILSALDARGPSNSLHKNYAN